MAYVAPSARTTGTLMTAVIWNQDAVDNIATIRAGGIAVASQAALGDVYPSSSTQLAYLAKGTKFSVRRLNNAESAFERGTPHWLRAFDDTQAATGANTTETVLYTFTAESSLLNVNGRTLRITAAGTFAANDTQKTVRVRWGGLGGTIAAVVTRENVSSDLTTYTGWFIEACISRLASNSQRLVGRGQMMSVLTDAEAVPYTQLTITTAAITETGVITLVVTGQNASANANNIVYECAWVEQLGGPA